ncbi:hypothetical protein FSP39_017794 [Pinctada imbricata]|uniref:Uncharacterized protein n=1 Tax=Pinctada imbricata TaxID=66713 RepID=A0AA88YKV5_PINIB|nr:hypothetical protein FSP39_017794 [Pinctada imbricata]
MKRCSLNPGNFAVKIVERLFPELFGEDNLRFQFSYNGGGIRDKKSLDGVRFRVHTKVRLSSLSGSQGNQSVEDDGCNTYQRTSPSPQREKEGPPSPFKSSSK